MDFSHFKIVMIVNGKSLQMTIAIQQLVELICRSLKKSFFLSMLNVFIIL